MRITEKILWVFFALSIIGRILDFSGSGLVLIFGFILTIFYFSLTYFLMIDADGYKLFLKDPSNKIGTAKSVYSIFSGILYSIVVTGIMFKALAFPGSRFLLIFSLFNLTLMWVLIRFGSFTNEHRRRILTRKLFMIIICIIFIFLSFMPLSIQEILFPI